VPLGQEMVPAGRSAALQLCDPAALQFSGAGAGKLLGQGAFGRVMLCSLSPHGPIALKTLQPTEKTLTAAARQTQHVGAGVSTTGLPVAEQLFLREAKTMLALSHP
jgi:hypothetical protein